MKKLDIIKHWQEYQLLNNRKSDENAGGNVSQFV